MFLSARYGYLLLWPLANGFSGCTADVTHEPVKKAIFAKHSTPSNTDSDSIPPLEYPVLNQNNYEDFLLEYFHSNPERKIKLRTRLGVVKFKLYEDTPLHSANFLMLVKRHYFDNTEFTRVVPKFVVQGGNNDKQSEEIKRLVIGNYLIAAEIQATHPHKRGALSMARVYEDNPGKLSSAYNFFIVEGQTFSEPQLLAIERENDMAIPLWKRELYGQIGGAPHLDNQHTVFGEVYEGFEILKEMSEVEVDQSEWPLIPLIMEMEVIDE